MDYKYIRDLDRTTLQLDNNDLLIVEKIDGSGTQIMKISDFIASILAKILKNNGTTSTAGSYALDARYGKTLRDDIDNVVPGLGWKVYSYQYTIGANGNLNITGGNLGISTPSGYTPIGTAALTTGDNNVVFRAFLPYSTGSSDPIVSLHNLSSSSVTATLTIRILYSKTGFVAGTLT